MMKQITETVSHQTFKTCLKRPGEMFIITQLFQLTEIFNVESSKSKWPKIYRTQFHFKLN